MLTATDSRILHKELNLTGGRLLLSAIIHHATKIEKVGLGCWLEVAFHDNITPATIPYLLLVELYAQRPESLTHLEVLYLGDLLHEYGDFFYAGPAFGDRVLEGNMPPKLQKVVLRHYLEKTTTEIPLLSSWDLCS